MDLFKSSLLTVVGTGEVFAVPDMVTVNCTIYSEDLDPNEVFIKNKTIAKKVFALFPQYNIIEKDVNTTAYEYGVKYDQNSKFVAYYLNNSLSIELKNIDEIGSLIEDLVKNGTNKINNITFDVKDKAKLLDEARTLAVKDAFRKAEILAKAANVKLGKIESLQETTLGYVLDGMKSFAGPPIAKGERSFKTSVNLVINIK